MATMSKDQIKLKIKGLEASNKILLKKLDKTKNQNQWNVYWKLLHSNKISIGKLRGKL